jgi:hypothetical protein
LHSVFVNGHFKCSFIKIGSSDGHTKHTHKQRHMSTPF